jgi:DNA-binding CsgD family transcriptional regulator
VWRWEEGVEDLVQDFCVDVLIGQGQLDFALAVAADLLHFRRLLARQLRHHLARRRQRTIVDNILERCKTLVSSPPFRLVADAPSWSYTVEGKQVGSGGSSVAGLREVAASLSGFPKIKSNSTVRAPVVYSTEVLAEVLQSVATALPHAVTVADLDRILSFLLTSWLPRFLEHGEGGDLRVAVDDLSVEERAIVAEVSDSIASGCSGIAREVLRLKVTGASDREIGRQLGMSRPTVAKHKHRLFHRLERALAPLSEEMRVAVIDSLGGAAGEGQEAEDPTVHGQSDPRMVLVIGLKAEIGVADVALVSNETEFASDVDIVIPAGNSGLPFALLVETGAVACLWCVQLGRLVAELGSELAQTVRQSALGERTMAVGSQRIRGEDASPDQRLLFKEREQRELGALSEDCREALVRPGSRSETVVDPALVDPATGGSKSRRFERWLTVAEILVGSQAATVPVAALESSLEICGAGPWSWGPDEVRALLPLVERVLADRPPGYEKGLEIDPARSRPAEAMDRELMAMLSAASKRGRRTVRLLTLPEAWTGESCESMGMARVATADGAELQIIRHNVEAGS